MLFRKPDYEYEALQPNPVLIGAGLCAIIIGAAALILLAVAG